MTHQHKKSIFPGSHPKQIKKFQSSERRYYFLKFTIGKKSNKFTQLLWLGCRHFLFCQGSADIVRIIFYRFQLSIKRMNFFFAQNVTYLPSGRSIGGRGVGGSTTRRSNRFDGDQPYTRNPKMFNLSSALSRWSAIFP